MYRLLRFHTNGIDLNAMLYTIRPGLAAVARPRGEPLKNFSRFSLALAIIHENTDALELAHHNRNPANRIWGGEVLM